MVDILKLRKMKSESNDVETEEKVEPAVQEEAPPQVEAKSEKKVAEKQPKAATAKPSGPESTPAAKPQSETGTQPEPKAKSEPEKKTPAPEKAQDKEPPKALKTKQDDAPQMDNKNADAEIDQHVLDLVVFTLAERLFAIDIIKVQEVVRYTEITRVPNAATYVLGVMNLRGNITPVIDLHKRFSLPEATWTDRTRIIVLQIRGQAIGFLVDHVSEIMHAKESDIESTSSVSANIGSDYISGVVKLSDDQQKDSAKKLLILLNLERVLDDGSVALT